MILNWKELEWQWRKELLPHATGNILEVGVETGENFEFYQPGVIVTAIDTSSRIIEKATLKAAAHNVNATFIVSTVEDLELKEHSFDTIVSTFSLSAYHDPNEVLAKYNHWCKPGGTILLLDYGLSRYPIVNWLQRKWEPYYYRKTGSHINRDMLAIISGSGLQVKKIEIKYAGIVYLVWASLVSKQINE